MRMTREKWMRSALLGAAMALGLVQVAAADGQDGFDFLIGKWKVHLKKLVKPLTGSTTWVESEGTSSARKILGGHGNMDEFVTEDPQTHAKTEGVTVRLFNAQTQEWRIYWISPRDGAIGLPVVGRFKEGRGEFYDQEEFQGRTIFVRYVWSNITANSAHFEQAFSVDGGKTWEVNWISDQVRVGS
jgi:hypothetical protein